MSLRTLVEIDPLAVCMAAITAYVLGGLWYTVLFSGAWSRAYGFREGEAIKLWTRPGVTITALFVCDLVGASVIALLIVGLDMRSLPAGALVGLIVWIGGAGAYGLGVQLASGRSMRGYAIDAGRQLASMLLMGAILGMWH